MATGYAHTNLIAEDWNRPSTFYQEVFGCVPIPPERDLSGEWLDRATGIHGASISGIHLRLPGYGDDGPTLEILQHGSMPEHSPVNPNTPDSRTWLLQSMTLRLQRGQSLITAGPLSARSQSERCPAWG